MQRKITDRFLSTLHAPAKGRIEVTDAEARGLVFRLTASGKASWAMRYRDQHGKQHRVTLGDYPALSLAKAREMVTTKRAGLIEGKNPKRAELVTLSDLIAEYLNRHAEANTRKPEQTKALYEKHVIPEIGRYRLDEIRRADVVALLDTLQDRGLNAQANRVQAAISAALNWGVDAGHILANPILGMKRRVKEAPRDRVLSDDELRAVWQAADRRTTPSREFIQLLILSMQRRDEVRAMRWDEIDTAARVWTIPARRNKAGRAHIVPLPKAAWDILETMPQLGPFVFTTDGEKPYAGQSTLGPAIRKASGVADWVLHDLRRTGRTGLSRLGVSALVAELVLNHARNDLEQTYDRHAFTDEKRDALERWSTHIRDVVLQGSEGAKIVAIR